jgi:hypothetical protein
VDTSENMPLAVADLAIAAQLLDRPLDQVQNAAREILVYEDVHGTRYFSLHQLTQVLRGVRPRTAPQRKPKPKLGREDAEAAATLAETATFEQVAEAYGVKAWALPRIWADYGIARPERHGRPGARAGGSLGA